MKKMIIHNSDSCVVKYDHQQACLSLACTDKLHPLEFKEGLVKALVFAEEHEIKNWLLDVHEIGCLNEEEEAWLQSYHFPRLMSSLGCNNQIAVVLSRLCYNELLQEAGAYGLKSYNSFITINTFCEVEEAEAWLSKEKFAAPAE